MSGVARYHAETASPHPQGAFVLYEDYAALLERIAALEADAARYQWLKLESNYETAAMAYHLHRVKAAYEVITSPWPKWDAAIDAALDAAKVGG